MTEVDLIIIGGGPGGYETALSASRAGLRTVLIEAEKLGGTCLNEGCIPTKCLCRTAEVVEICKGAEVFGIECIDVKFDIKKAQERKNQIVEALQSGVLTLMSSAKVQVIYGWAKFSDRKTVVVENAVTLDGISADSEYTAKNIIIATGSKPKFLPVAGSGLEGVLTSKELLSIETIPASLCIIGGGVIGIEFASIFSSFGSKVSVIEFCKEILPNFDTELSKRLRLNLKRKGVAFYTGSAVTEIKKVDNRFSVSYRTGNDEDKIEADVVLMAVGRVANTDSLNLQDVGVMTDKRGIVVDENFQTSVKGVYAVGDINGICQLAHAAKFQGQRVLKAIMGESDSFNFGVIPAAVFTDPEFAMVGKTENECRTNDIAYKVHKAFFRANGKALALNSSEGLVKLITSSDDKILGCHILGPHASDLIEEVAIVMQHEGNLDDIRQTIHAHPTLGEVVWEAAAE